MLPNRLRRRRWKAALAGFILLVLAGTVAARLWRGDMAASSVSPPAPAAGQAVVLKDAYVPKGFTVHEAQAIFDALARQMPLAADAFRRSAHYREGMTCVTCHQELRWDQASGSVDVTSLGRVPPERCGECHEQEYDGFRKSRHFKAVTVFREVVRYKALAGYPAMQQQGCNRCHEPIGQSCSACHPAHLFEPPRPPKDEFGGCQRCHLGPDHHQLESYVASVHYQVARARGDGIPNCVFCHTADDNKHHIFRIKGTKDHGRTALMAKCTQCHTEQFARRAFEGIDAIKHETNKVVDAARQIIRDLYADGILNRVSGSLTDEQGLPALNPNLTAYDQHVHPIENLMFRMFKYDAVATIAGAQHFSAVRTHWYGHAQLMETYNRIRQMAQELRFMHALSKKLGVPLPSIPVYRYTHETGRELDEPWHDPVGYRKRLAEFYSEVNE